MITEEDVRQGFMAFLGREPESAATIQLFLTCSDRAELAKILARSREFELKSGFSQPNETTPSLALIYFLIYERPLDAAEANRLAFYGIDLKLPPSQIVRRVIGATDRQVSPTRYLVHFGPEDITYTDLEGFKLALDVADVAVSSIIRDEHRYELHLTSFFRRHVKPGMSVVDVGANIGYYTMLAASLVGKDGSVTAFEPNSENARLILLSVEQNGFSQVNVIPLALSNKTGSAFFSPHMGSNGGLLPGTEESLMNPQCIVVPTMRMDDILANRVDFIKVDTEGAEGLILAGATRIIDRDRPIISSEFSPEMLARVSGVDAFEFLMSFKRRDYRIMTLDRSAGQDAEVELDDVPAFIRNYGSPTRIEEIVFVP